MPRPHPTAGRPPQADIIITCPFPARRTVAALCLALATVVSAADAPEKTNPIEPMRQTILEWAKVRTETVRLEESWQQEQELMHSALVALQEQVTRLETDKKNLEASTAGERDTLADLAARNAAVESGLNNAGIRLQKVAEQLVALRPSLPPRLSAALELPYRSLGNSELGTTDRMRLVTTVLNRCAQFGRVISDGEEILTLDGETEGRMREVIYWGISHGYALDRAAARAYWGHPGPRGWTWEYDPALAPAVAQLIAIHRDKADPRNVAIPVQIGAAASN